MDNMSMVVHKYICRAHMRWSAFTFKVPDLLNTGEVDMNISTNSINFKMSHFFPIELQVSFADTPPTEIQLDQTQFKTLQHTRKEIRFEIDRALAPNATISIKMAKRSPEKKPAGDVYKVHRGRIRYCNEIKSSLNPRYEICVQILESVIQTEIRSSHLKFN